MNAPKHSRKTLPKWAQQEFGLMEMLLREARSQIAALTNSEPTRVELEPYHAKDGPLSYLPNDTRIRWAMSAAKSWRDFIDVKKGYGRLEIHASDTLEIVPWSTNIIHLRLRKQP